MMKKYITPLFTIVVSSVLAVVLVVPLFAEDSVLDQSNETGGACLTAYSGYNRNQTFIPVKNVLTKVEVKMKNMNGGDIILTVKDEGTGQVVLQTNQRMGVGDDWETFSLVGESLGYILDTDHQHSIWIGTSYWPGADAPCWFYSGSEAYGNGNRRTGSTDEAGDMTFRTYGYDIDMGRENPEPPAEDPPAEEPATEEPAADEPESPAMDQPGSSVVPDEPTAIADLVEVEESDDVTDPTLEEVIVDNEIIIVEDGMVTVIEKNAVKVTGTADAGDTVTVFIGDSAYTATADEDGNWYVLFSVSELDDGEYKVEAQASNDDGGSAVVTLFSLTKGEKAVVEEETEEDEAEDTSFWYRFTQGDLVWALMVAIFFLLFFPVVFYLYASWKKKKKDENPPALNKLKG